MKISDRFTDYGMIGGTFWLLQSLLYLALGGAERNLRARLFLEYLNRFGGVDSWRNRIDSRLLDGATARSLRWSDVPVGRSARSSKAYSSTSDLVQRVYGSERALHSAGLLIASCYAYLLTTFHS